MEANDLMIGDLVKVRATFDIYRKVTSVGDCDICTLDDAVEYDCDEIEPILLTAEILEKNGLKNIFRGRYEYKEDGKFIIEVSMNKDKGEIMWIRLSTFDDEGWEDNVTSIKKIKYVHLFQHALRLCGLNELADNFKI